jgi:ATP-dependent DNA ligase
MRHVSARALPAVAGQRPPAGTDWLHEIKHDGFRILALRDAGGVRLYTRNGHDFGKRFPLVVATKQFEMPCDT